MLRWPLLWAVLGLLLAGRSAISAEPAGAVTIIEGDAVAIRALSKLGLARGVRVMGDDLVETGKTAFVQIEFFDGAKADLGPSTRLQLNRPALRRAERPALYLLSGWLKLSAGRPGSAAASFACPQFDAGDLTGAAVAHVEPGRSELFAESGPLRVVDRRGGSGAQFTMQPGDFVALRAREAVRVERRAAPDFVKAIPRPFMDPMPSILDQVGEVPPKSLGSFTYEEVEPWLDAEPLIRRRFVVDWAAKADEPAFRERLENRLARHPEWEKVLYADRTAPEEAKPVASTPPAIAAPPASTPDARTPTQPR